MLPCSMRWIHCGADPAAVCRTTKIRRAVGGACQSDGSQDLRPRAGIVAGDLIIQSGRCKATRPAEKGKCEINA